MSDRAYYWSALAFPLIVAIAALLVLGLWHVQPEGRILGSVFGFVMAFALYGSMPYALFALGVLILMRHASASSLRRLTLFAPLFLVALMWLVAAVYDVVTGPDVSQWPVGAGMLGVVVLLVGYGYAGVVECGYQIRRRLRAQPMRAA